MKMKKVIVSMLMATAMIAGGTMYAQSPTDGSTGATTKQESCQNCPQHQGDKKCDKAGKGKGNKPKFNPFEGIQLTPAQQQRLQVLREGLGPVRLDSAQQANIPQNPALTKEQKRQLKAERKAKKIETKKKYLQGVKETLNPDQYVVFLENCYIYTSKSPDKQLNLKHGKGQKGKDHKGKKGDKKGKRPGNEAKGSK